MRRTGYGEFVALLHIAVEDSNRTAIIEFHQVDVSAFNRQPDSSITFTFKVSNFTVNHSTKVPPAAAK